MSDRYPTLIKLLGPQLDAMERICAAWPLTEGDADFHYHKADSRMVRSGPHYVERDEKSGELHLLHGSVQLMLAAKRADKSEGA